MDSRNHSPFRAAVSRWHEQAVRVAGWWRVPWVRWPVLGITGLTWVLILASPWAELVRRTDESWPHHRLFLVLKDRRPERGELVAFRMTPELAARVQPSRERPYARVGQLWLKRLWGMPGDRVETSTLPDDRTAVTVNGVSAGIALPADRFGQALAPAALPSPIPADRFYVMLSHPRSFDSRYWGYLRRDELLGVAVPLW